MPSNYTIAKTLQRVAYYREICGHSPHSYGGTATEVQALKGQRLDAIENQGAEQLRALLNEADDAVIQTIQEILQGKEITALTPDTVPLSILEITEIKGLGAKMARRVFEEIGVVDLAGLKAAAENGTLSKVKGFGQKMSEKILGHIQKVAAKEKP